MVSKSKIAQLWFWPIVAFIFAIFAVALALALIVVTKQRDDLQSGKTTTTTVTSNATGPAVCGTTNTNGNTVDLTEPASPGPFHDLTGSEIKAVRTYLENHSDTKAAKAGTATLTSSYILMMDLMLPTKSEVTSYLSKNTAATPPNRAARVVLFRGDKSPPSVEEWKCGPLQNIFDCYLLQSTETSTRNSVEFSLRPLSNIEISSSGLSLLLKTLDTELSTLLKESYNATFTQCTQPKDCFSLLVSPLSSQYNNDINERFVWLFPTYNLSYYSMHPVGLGILLQLSGVDSTKWSYSKLWYSGKLFNTVAALNDFYSTNITSRIKLSKPADSDTLYSALGKRAASQPVNAQRPPATVEPDGKRYSLKSREVNYLNWAFNFRMSTFSGPALFDVRFKGERIAYEIALSEFAAFHSGLSPLPQTSDYIGSSSMVGIQYRSLVPGGDCPDIATLVNQSFYNQYGDSPSVTYVTFCLFEHNSNAPLRRHLSYTQGQGGFYGGMLNSALVLRSALTIWNFDYIVDFIFHQNGALEAQFISSGYILSSFYSEEERAYGSNLGHWMLGNLNHHLVNFKLDLDIVNTKNRYQTLDIEVDKISTSNNLGKDVNQNKIVRTLKQTEVDALYQFDFSHPKQHVVFSNSTKNSFGESKGYRIEIKGMSKSLLPQDIGKERSIPWSRYQMAVTKQKDSEIRSSSVYAVFDAAKPATNFTDFYADNESILDEDLVFWVTCGSYHVPRSEDLPLKTTLGSDMGFYLLPFNYHDECPSMSSRDAIYIHYTDPSNPKKGLTVDRNGNSATQCLTPKPTLESDLASKPDHVIETNHGNYVY